MSGNGVSSGLFKILEQKTNEILKQQKAQTEQTTQSTYTPQNPYLQQMQQNDEAKAQQDTQTQAQQQNGINAYQTYSNIFENLNSSNGGGVRTSEEDFLSGNISNDDSAALMLYEIAKQDGDNTTITKEELQQAEDLYEDEDDIAQLLKIAGYTDEEIKEFLNSEANSAMSSITASKIKKDIDEEGNAAYSLEIEEYKEDNTADNLDCVSRILYNVYGIEYDPENEIVQEFLEANNITDADLVFKDTIAFLPDTDGILSQRLGEVKEAEQEETTVSNDTTTNKSEGMTSYDRYQRMMEEKEEERIKTNTPNSQERYERMMREKEESLNNESETEYDSFQQEENERLAQTWLNKDASQCSEEELMQASALDILNNQAQSQQTFLEAQDENDGALSKAYNGFKELTDFKIDRTEAQEALDEQNKSIKKLHQALLGNSELSFEETYKEVYGVEYDEEKIMQYQEENMKAQFMSAFMQNAQIFKYELGNSEDINEQYEIIKTYYNDDEKAEQEFSELLLESMKLYGAGVPIDDVEIDESGKVTFTNNGVLALEYPSIDDMPISELNITAVDKNKYVDESLEKFEEVMGIKPEELQENLNKVKKEAFGEATKFEEIITDYCNSQEGFIDGVAQAVQIAGIIVVAVGGIMTICGNVGGVKVMSAGSKLATAGTFMDEGAELLDTVTSKNNKDFERYADIAKETLMDAAMYASGVGIGKVSGAVGNEVLKKSGSKLLSLSTERGTDTVLSLMASYAMTGEIDLKGEGLSQILAVLSGVASKKASVAKANAEAKKVAEAEAQKPPTVDAEVVDSTPRDRELMPVNTKEKEVIDLEDGEWQIYDIDDANALPNNTAGAIEQKGQQTTNAPKDIDTDTAKANESQSAEANKAAENAKPKAEADEAVSNSKRKAQGAAETDAAKANEVNIKRNQNGTIESVSYTDSQGNSTNAKILRKNEQLNANESYFVENNSAIKLGDEVIDLDTALKGKKNGTYTIGREGDIKINDKTVSRKHLEVTKTDDGYILKDLGSMNGTKVQTYQDIDFKNIKMSNRVNPELANKKMSDALTPEQQKVYNDSYHAYQRSKNKTIRHDHTHDNIISQDNLVHAVSSNNVASILEQGMLPRELTGNEGAKFANGQSADTKSPLACDFWGVEAKYTIKDYFNVNKRTSCSGERGFLPNNAKDTGTDAAIIYKKSAMDETLLNNSFKMNSKEGKTTLGGNANPLYDAFKGKDGQLGHNYDTHIAVPGAVPSNAIDRIVLNTESPYFDRNLANIKETIKAQGLDIKVYDLFGNPL